MPAVTVENPLVLPTIAQPGHQTTVSRPVGQVVPAHHAVEGAGFEVWRPVPSGLDLHVSDPFLLLDQLGPVSYAPGEEKGAPWHPHRGFETVTYVLDGEISHHDSNGGGGTIGEGDTQWMTAGVPSGVIATPNGPKPTGIGVPGVLDATSIGVTVLLPRLTTKVVTPGGVTAGAQ